MESNDHGPFGHKVGDPELLRHTLCRNQQGEGTWQQGRRVGRSSPGQRHSLDWSNISIDRILNCTKKMNGQLCEAVIKRERWVEHLHKRAEHMAETNEEMVNRILNTTYNV
eukprot:scaffold17084_cov89-Skeletonema_dohrnii-CCMP3373.AAC.1